MKYIIIFLFLISMNNCLSASELVYLTSDSTIVTSAKDTLHNNKTTLSKSNDTLNVRPQKTQTTDLDKIIKSNGDSILSKINWKNVIITYESTDVSGLAEKGQVDAYFEAKNMSSDNETLEKKAYAIMQKKAYSMNASIVLITEKKFSRMYGELPSIKIAGTAYGKE